VEAIDRELLQVQLLACSRSSDVRKSI